MAKFSRCRNVVFFVLLNKTAS